MGRQGGIVAKRLSPSATNRSAGASGICSFGFLALLVMPVLILLVPLASDAAEGTPWKLNTVMIQGFHWESHMTKPWFKVMESKASDLAASGITAVWFPPSSAAASDEGYLPTRLYLQDSQYGTAAALKSSIAALHAKGIKALADIVINHRCGATDWADFKEPEWGPEAVCSDDEWPWAKGNPDTGSRYNAGRDIDHTQKHIRASIVEWMNWLKTEIGFDGWRYDYVKGFDGSYVGMYNEATKPAFSVGELWDYLQWDDPNPHRQQLCDWIDAAKARTAAFDFTTKGLLQKAIENNEYWRLVDKEGKPAGLIGWWPDHAVTFIDNHDTGASTGGEGGQNHWPFPPDRVLEGYAYILTHPGIPCIYWVHFYDWGLHDEIVKLLKLRKSLGINAMSKVKVMKTQSDLYAAIIDGKVAMKIGPGNWSPGPEWKLAASGRCFAVWTGKVRKGAGRKTSGQTGK